MTKNSIVSEHDINLPTEIHVSDVDMTIIMGNLLDNAIEACLDVEDKSRYINLDIVCGYGKIDILIKNSIDGKVFITESDLFITPILTIKISMIYLGQRLQSYEFNKEDITFFVNKRTD